MANPEHLAILKQGVERWNEWRKVRPGLPIDLREAGLSGRDFRFADFIRVDLHGSSLRGANLSGAALVGAKLRRADLMSVDFRNANLRGANLNRSDLVDADLRRANFTGADLSGSNLYLADLYGTNLQAADLNGANLTGAKVGGTIFADCDLSLTNGLSSVEHSGPSTVGLDTISNSRGRIPDLFLRGCGLRDWEIAAAKLYDSHLTAGMVAKIVAQVASLRMQQPIEYYSCFISYSTKDQAFADRLYDDLQAKGVRCWFAPHDMKPAQKIHEQIDEAIRLHDKLLLILSEHSMTSDWVGTEISKARKREVQENKRMLFPITVAPFDRVKAWELFDGDRGKDSAREIREYYIPDFSGWERDAAGYQKEFEKLATALKAGASG
jgi:hypothetical protein